MDLLELDEEIDISHWYYYSKYKAMLKILKEASAWPPGSRDDGIIVDVGAGSAIFTRAFLKELGPNGKAAYAVDKNYSEGRIGFHNGVHFCAELPGEADPFYFFFVDVIEHIDEDALFLKNWSRKSKSGSVFLLTAPAYNWLWSSHDDFLKHKRRYSLNELEKIALEADLAILKSCYYFSTLLPFAVVKRKVLEPLLNNFGFFFKPGIRATNKNINSLLKAIQKVETAFIPLNRFFGLTCIVVAKKT